MTEKSLLAQFLADRVYSNGVVKDTVRYYKGVFRAFRDVDLETPDDGLLDRIKAKVAQLMERNLSPHSINNYLRGVRAYVNWLYNEGYLEKPLKIKLLRADDPAIETYAPEDVHKLLTARPLNRFEPRLQCILAVIFDTGARIGEVLDLTRDCVDLDNLLVTFRRTKARKPRVVPFGQLTRKMLYRHLQSHNHDRVFCTRDGRRLHPLNLRKEFCILRRRLRITHPPKAGFHVCRHTFAVEFLRAGGDVFTLQRILGHSTLEMTRRYVHLNVADLQRGHRQYATLVR